MQGNAFVLQCIIKVKKKKMCSVISTSYKSVQTGSCVCLGPKNEKKYNLFKPRPEFFPWTAKIATSHSCDEGE